MFRVRRSTEGWLRSEVRNSFATRGEKRGLLLVWRQVSMTIETTWLYRASGSRENDFQACRTDTTRLEVLSTTPLGLQRRSTSTKEK